MVKKLNRFLIILMSLCVIAFSSFAFAIPSVTVNLPNGGEKLSGIESVSWDAVDSGPTTTFVVLYSSGDSFSVITDEDGNLANKLGPSERSVNWDTKTVVDGSNYKIKLQAWQSGSNVSSDVSDNTFIVDNTKPTSSANALSQYQTTSVFNVGYTAIDTTSGIANVKLFYRKDNGNWIQDGISTSSPISFNSANTGGDGVYDFYTISTDNAGNIEAKNPTNESSTTVDTVKPTTTDDAPTGWQKTSPINITLTLTDPLHSSGITMTNYCIDDDNLCDPFTAGVVYTDEEIIPISSQGISYLRYASKDNAGNIQDTMSKAIMIDTEVPSSVVEELGVYQTTKVFNINYSADDEISKVASIKLFYRKDSNDEDDWIEYGTFTSSPISFDTTNTGGDESYEFYTIATDNAGNVENKPAEVEASTTVDTVKPTTTDDALTGWQTTKPITVTLFPFDIAPSSEIEWTKYCTDTLNTCEPSNGNLYTTPVNISNNGTTYFRYASKDNAGNIQNTVSKAVMIDTVKPTSSANALSQYQTTAIFNVGYTTIETTSGIANVKLFYRKNNGNWIQDGISTSSPISFNSANTSGDGFYEFYTIATDNAGNTEVKNPINESSTTVDSVKPSITTYTINNSAFSPNGDLIKDNVTIDVEFSETSDYSIKIKNITGATVKSFSGSAKDPNPRIWDGTGNTGNGSYTIEVTITDLAGNTNADSTKTIKLDTNVPTIATISILPSFIKDTMRYISNRSTISAVVTETLSGIEKCEYTLDDGDSWSNADFNSDTSTCTKANVDTTSASSINLRAEDNAGNIGVGANLEVNVDNSISAIVLSAGDGTNIATKLDGTEFLRDSDTLISIMVTETKSGVSSVKAYYTVDGTTPTVNSPSIIMTTTGINSPFTYAGTIPANAVNNGEVVKFITVSIDNVGNSYTTQVSSYVIDGEIPLITEISNVSLAQAGQDITINANISDINSGINLNKVILHYTINGSNETEVLMTNIEGDIFKGIIQSTQTTMITYFISVDDNVGNKVMSNSNTITIKEFLLSLNTGWNLISIPERIQDDKSSTALFPNLAVFGYNATKNEWYGEPDDIQIMQGIGYWIDSDKKTQVPMDFEDCVGVNCIPSDTINLVPGWNLIGHMCNKEQNIADIPSFRVDSTNQLFILNYNVSEFGICSLQSNNWVCDGNFGDAVLEPGKGYWVFSDVEIPYTNVC